MFQQILHPLFWLLSHSCQVVITFSFTVSFQHFPVDFARFPLIVIMFSCSFYILFVGFQSIHAFLIYFSKIFTRLLFAPFPLVCCIFNVFFQEFYPSPSFSDRFCTISSGCYRIFLHFHCLFPTCLLHRHSLFLAVTPVSSMFQQILHGLFLAFAPFSSVFQGFCTISSDRYHVFVQLHCIFQYILMVSPATKKADLGGIDTPPSANYLVVHNPAKCSVFWRSTQGHGEISFPFGNHPPHTPYSHFVRKQQLAS